MIRVQAEPFDPGMELARFGQGRTDIGAVATFLGLVRDVHGGERIAAMTLEHYPGMTERQLAAIEAEARARWPLDDCLVIHRYGRMLPGEPIVLVATASAHRHAALEACAFLIDWLKTKAPFWKLEETETGESRWVEARESDEEAAARW
ncbi:molybdenum cofactor biosynthesis protein MoaE [Benzoatithermus flavus]|uniref:Molybdopterin synthase catalytic subunit n=1 Tax=Benzoatithermus flavus TaxID=3108223 RepID=A0ABU8XYP9_9PROT